MTEIRPKASDPSSSREPVQGARAHQGRGRGAAALDTSLCSIPLTQSCPPPAESGLSRALMVLVNQAGNTGAMLEWTSFPDVWALGLFTVLHDTLHPVLAA
jgi:hypothetical protein